MLSTVALPVACVPSIADAALAASPDAKLLDLGQRFDAAAGAEKALFKQSEMQLASVDLAPFRRTLRYRAENRTDSAIATLLGEPNADWESFGPAEVRGLRRMAKTGRKLVDDRVTQLVAAQEQIDRFFERSDVATVTRACEEARDRTGSIVEQISKQTANTVEGLVVKAKAVSWCWSDELDDVEEIGTTTDMTILRTMVKDLVALGTPAIKA